MRGPATGLRGARLPHQRAYPRGAPGHQPRHPQGGDGLHRRPIGGRQEHAPPDPGNPGSTHSRLRALRRHRHLLAQRGEAERVPQRAHRVRLPVPPSAGRVLRPGERDAPGGALVAERAARQQDAGDGTANRPGRGRSASADRRRGRLEQPLSAGGRGSTLPGHEVVAAPQSDAAPAQGGGPRGIRRRGRVGRARAARRMVGAGRGAW